MIDKKRDRRKIRKGSNEGKKSKKQYQERVRDERVRERTERFGTG